MFREKKFASEMMSAADHFEEKCVVEVELVRCKCCGLMEECTPAYIDLIRETFCGRWICGLCAEAVKDEFYRSGNKYIEMKAAHGIKSCRSSGVCCRNTEARS